MPKLQDAVAAAILEALLNDPSKLTLLSRILTFFTLIRLPLQRFRPDLFKKLRSDAWIIDEEDYRVSFQIKNEKGKPYLHPLSELGYSGSVSLNKQ